LNAVGREKSIKEKCGGNKSDVAAVSRGAGVLWGAMSEADKKPYVAIAEKDKARYAKEMASYVPDPDAEPKKKKGKKGKKEKDPNKPKKPGHPYMLWLTENRAEIAKDPAVKVNTDVMKVAGQKWAALSAAAKAPYEKAAKEAKEKYDKVMAEYKANLPADDDDDDEDEE
jgi:upstream-binding transcription factor